MEYTSKSPFRLIKKIKDPKFTIDDLHHYDLSMHLGMKDFQVLVTDSQTNRCVLLEDYIFEKTSDEQTRNDILHALFDDHHLLMAGFWKSVTLAIKNKKYSFIPPEIYSIENISSYLALNSDYHPEQDEVIVTFHERAGFINVFAVEESVIDFIREMYPAKKVRLIHQCSALISGVLSSENDEKHMALYVDRFGLHIIVVNNNKLVFYNQYTIKAFNDYMRFVNMVAHELEINLTEKNILLYGYMGEQTPHYSALKESIHRLSPGNRPSGLEYGYVFDEISDHQYFDLFSLPSV